MLQKLKQCIPNIILSYSHMDEFSYSFVLQSVERKVGLSAARHTHTADDSLKVFNDNKVNRIIESDRQSEITTVHMCELRPAQNPATNKEL